MKNWYAKLTAAQKARLWTLLISVMTLIASSADKVIALPWVPACVANAWPVIVSVDMIVLKLINILTDPNAKPNITADAQKQ